ncbi:hypothetical protein BDV26DRAFT_273492 [Aspergillus bertholletiae]|uniref:Uncharacterized protein n=1 Tax=Aspergillus bertholletiae TaxID=1226010 RepID=A0A5N7AVE2_9EURO|nr:hypothetical protein BDV26DRAFT_273492 [Aspergillus bertholletiae]
MQPTVPLLSPATPSYLTIRPPRLPRRTLWTFLLLVGRVNKACESHSLFACHLQDKSMPCPSPLLPLPPHNLNRNRM